MSADLDKEIDNITQTLNVEFDDLFKSSFPYSSRKPIRVKDELARREKLKNDDYDQDIKLKKLTLFVLLIFLAVETVTIFAFAFFQATSTFNFFLEELSFKLLVTATITQIYFMLRIAIEYLFPRNNK